MSNDKISNKDTRDYRRETYQPSRTALDRGGRTPSLNRVEKSPFDKILEETSQNADSLPNSRPEGTSQTETREAIRAVVSQQDRYGKDKDHKSEFQKKLTEKETDRDESRLKPSGDTSGLRAKEAEKRVIGRESPGEKKHEGGGHSQGHGEGGGMGQGQGKKGGKGMSLGMSSRDMKGEGKVSVKEAGKAFHLENLVSPQGKQALTPEISETKHLSQTLPKALIDQIVQYCRLVTRTDGDKEMEMQLHENIFKGLRLRVVLKEGKISVSLLASSDEVRGFFQARKQEMQESLMEKGIEVKAIDVIMI